jgi:hypothetical protein
VVSTDSMMDERPSAMMNLSVSFLVSKREEKELMMLMMSDDEQRIEVCSVSRVMLTRMPTTRSACSLEQSGRDTTSQRVASVLH